MRSHGWNGEPPRDAAEARARIMTPPGRGSPRRARPRPRRSPRSSGVTRQTVYRYFPSTEELLNAAAMDAVTELESQLVAHVARLLAEGGDAGDAVVEIVAYVYEHLRDDPALNRLIAPGRLSSTVAGLTAPTSIALGSSLAGPVPRRLGRDGAAGRAAARAGRAPAPHASVTRARPGQPGAHRRRAPRLPPAVGRARPAGRRRLRLSRQQRRPYPGDRAEAAALCCCCSLSSLCQPNLSFPCAKAGSDLCKVED